MTSQSMGLAVPKRADKAGISHPQTSFRLRDRWVDADKDVQWCFEYFGGLTLRVVAQY
jgi:hypothetical protein